MSALSMDRLTAFVRRGREPDHAPSRDTHEPGMPPRRGIGPVGTATRLLAGSVLLGVIVDGEWSTARQLTPTAWLLGLLGLPAVVLIWHVWRVRRDPAPFVDSSPLNFALSLAVPLALYFLGWFVRPLGFTSDATMIFIGGSLLLAALRGSAGCEFLAPSNWVLRRNDQLACAVFTPLDFLDRRRSRA